MKLFTFQEIFTEAPPNFLSFEKDKIACFFSNNVLPKKVPNPRPALELTAFDLLFIYGSPITVFISSGNPGPLSLIITSIVFSSFSNIMLTSLFENLTALPIKFLKP